MTKGLKILLAVAVLAALATPAFAGGARHYPNGAEAFWMGAAPPPGFYFMNYNLFYNSHEYMDAGGNEVRAGPLDGFKINYYANVSRFIWISDCKLFGANYGMHTFIPFVDVDIHTNGRKDHATGLGDIIIDPFILSWHWPNFHLTTGLDIHVPTGEYERGHMANQGWNHWTFEPIIAVTWKPLDDLPLNLSVKFMYDFNTKNSRGTNPMTGLQADVVCGQELHFDYSLDYQLADWLKLGIGGYFYHQITRDKVDGDRVQGEMGSRSQTFAIGPCFEIKQGRLFVRGQYQQELHSQSMQKGQAFWLTVTWVF